MVNASQGTGEPITMITTFRLTQDRDEFESAVTDQVELLSGCDGFVRSQLLRSLRHPGTYVNVGQWRDPAAHLAAVRGRNFYITYAILSELAEAVSDQAVRVLGSGEPQPVPDPCPAAPTTTVLTSFDLAEGADSAQFEQRFEDHARFMRSQDGFAAHLLVRSVRQPRHYVNIGWWRDPAAYFAVMQTEEFGRDARGMAALAQAEGDMFEVMRNLAAAGAAAVVAV
jgi:heme-degrading monooxygenase HmoA